MLKQKKKQKNKINTVRICQKGAEIQLVKNIIRIDFQRESRQTLNNNEPKKNK